MYISNMYIYIGLHVKCPKFSPDFDETRFFSTDLRDIVT